LALAQIAKDAGLPNGVFNVIPSDRESTADISRFICESHDVDVISFTGSTAVGKILLQQSANVVKRVCLELGGNAPFIIFESADIDKAVQGTIASKFRCSGQTCVAANRILVQASIHDQFVEKLGAAMKKLTTGHGMDKNVTLGPLINKKAVEKVTHLVEDATKKGAVIHMGGKAVEGTNVFEPTLMTNIHGEMHIAHVETFGPIAPIQMFESEEEVIQKANASRSGLAGYFYSQNIQQIHRVARRLHVGMVGINEGIISCAEAAFGGVKESGLGREGASQGIDEFTQWKYVCLNTA
jgi:succinate-semialdehyde dehydrogenase